MNLDIIITYKIFSNEVYVYTKSLIKQKKSLSIVMNRLLETINMDKSIVWN